MATEVGSLYYDLNIDDKNLRTQLDAADKNVQKFGDNASESFDKFQKGAKVAAIGLGVVGAGLTLYAKNATDFTVDLVKSSKNLGVQIGVSTTEASRLVAAFGRMGIEAGAASQMFGIFSKQIVASTKDSEGKALATQKLNIQIKQTEMAIRDTTAAIAKDGDASGQLSLKLEDLNNTLASQKQQLNQSTDAFQKLGISTKDASGKQKDFNTILFETADKFKAMPNGIDKSALAMELFGRSGKDMIKVLNLGSAGIQDLEKQADRLGLTLNANTIGSINKLVQEQKELKQQTDAMKIAVGTATAPVLTEFTSKLNGVVMALLNADGPLRAVTVSVLAFGGPVAGAAAGMLGFIANLDQAKGALSALAGGFTGLIGLLQSPWVLAFIAAGVAVAGVTSYLLSNQTQSERLKEAQTNLTAATNQLKLAQDSLADANLNLQGTSLAVEQAQRSYNEAVAQYGPTSLEARTAAYNLAVAQDRHRDASNQVRDALQRVGDKSREVARDQALLNHLYNVAGAADGVRRAADGAVYSINRLAAAATTTNSTGQRIDLSPLLRRAKGGPVEVGHEYLTGEKGPELFIPNQSGTIIPADMTKRMMGRFDSSTPGNAMPNPGVTTNFFQPVQIYGMSDAEQILQTVTRNNSLALEGVAVARP